MRLRSRRPPLSTPRQCFALTFEYCMPIKETAKVNLIVFGLFRPGIEPAIFRHVSENTVGTRPLCLLILLHWPIFDLLEFIAKLVSFEQNRLHCLKKNCNANSYSENLYKKTRVMAFSLFVDELSKQS